MTFLQWITSKVRLRWLGANNYNLESLEQDDFDEAIVKLKEAGWCPVKETEHSIMMTFGEEE